MPHRLETSHQLESVRLEDDGIIPNNPRLPLVLYRHALAWDDEADPADWIVERFRRHGWGGTWVDGIYPFHHYHASSHEVLGIARGHVDVQFGGSSGAIVRLMAGDAVVIPAGVGHCRRAATNDLSVVGAYPPGQENWDLRRATARDREEALAVIPGVANPSIDPVLGPDGPLPRLWS